MKSIETFWNSSKNFKDTSKIRIILLINIVKIDHRYPFEYASNKNPHSYVSTFILPLT